MAGSKESASFFDPHRTGVDFSLQPPAASHMNNAPAVDDPRQMTTHLQMSGLDRMRETRACVLFDKNRLRGDLAGAGATGRKTDFPFGLEHANNAAFDSGRTANDPRTAQTSRRANEKFAADIHRTRSRGDNLHIAQFNRGVAPRAKCIAGVAGDRVGFPAPVTKHISHFAG